MILSNKKISILRKKYSFEIHFIEVKVLKSNFFGYNT